MEQKREATVTMKLSRGLGLPLLAGADREHIDYFFDEETWRRVRETAEAEGVDPRALISEMVGWALRARARSQ